MISFSTGKKFTFPLSFLSFMRVWHSVIPELAATPFGGPNTHALLGPLSLSSHFILLFGEVPSKTIKYSHHPILAESPMRHKPCTALHTRSCLPTSSSKSMAVGAKTKAHRLPLVRSVPKMQRDDFGNAGIGNTQEVGCKALAGKSRIACWVHMSTHVDAGLKQLPSLSLRSH